MLAIEHDALPGVTVIAADRVNSHACSTLPFSQQLSLREAVLKAEGSKFSRQERDVSCCCGPKKLNLLWVLSIVLPS